MFAIKTSLISSNDIQYSISSLNPGPSEVITYNRDGTPRDRFGDHSWFLQDVNGVQFRADFGGLAIESPCKLADHNIQLLRRIMIFMLFAYDSAISLSSVRSAWYVLRRLVIFVNRNNIMLDSLFRYDKLVETWAESENPSSLYVLHALSASINAYLDTLGFQLLSYDQCELLKRRARLETVRHQTPFIPQRLHDELLRTCHRVVDEFLSIKDEFAEVYRLTDERCRSDLPALRKSPYQQLVSSRPNLMRVLVDAGRPVARPAGLVGYMNDVRKACLILAANYTLARRHELYKLTSESYRELDNPSIGPVSVIISCTTKTQNTQSGIWVSTPKIIPSLKVLEFIARITSSNTAGETALLNSLETVFTGHSRSDQISFALSQLNSSSAPMFLRTETFKITKEDMSEAIAVTPDIDQRRINVGGVWPFALHQFRRTMIVRCAASGIVSPQALAFQAKHQTLGMTWHYLKNYWKLRRDEVNGEELRLTDESIAEEFTTEYVDRFNDSLEIGRRSPHLFSAYGEKHKLRLFDAVPLLSLEDVRNGEKTGTLKKTCAGLCFELDHCDYSTARSVKGCMTKQQGNMCTKALLDVRNLEAIEQIVEDAKDEMEMLSGRTGSEFKITVLEADIEFGKLAITMMKEKLAETVNE